MKGRHVYARRLRKQIGFTWARLVNHDCRTVTWRLFRRDLDGRCHMEAVTFGADAAEWAVATRLRTARKRLLDHVDSIDLAILGVTA